MFAFCSGSSNPGLAGAIAKSLGQQLGDINLSTFPDGETKVEIIDPIRGHDVFVIQVRPFDCSPVGLNDPLTLCRLFFPILTSLSY